MADSSSSATIAVTFLSLDGGHAVVIDDDGRVGYAYLLDSGGKICGDVWLYNRGPPPKESEWTDQEKAPFANPEAYVDLGSEFFPPVSADDISVEWSQDAGACEVRIFIRRKFVAKMIPGSKPGWSSLVKRDGPLARVFKQ